MIINDSKMWGFQISQVWMTCFWKFGNISLTKTVEKKGLHQQDSEYWNHQKMGGFHSGVLMDRSNSKPAASPLKPWTSARIKIKFVTKESSSTIIFVTVNMLVITILLTYHKMILIMDIAGLFFLGLYKFWLFLLATFQDSSPGPQFASPGTWTNYHPGNSSGWASSPRRPGGDDAWDRWICTDIDLHLLNVYIYIHKLTWNITKIYVIYLLVYI